MARKIRFPRKVLLARTETDALRDHYEELSPPWSLGSVDYRTAFDWDPAVFGARKRPHAHGSKRDPRRVA